MTSSLTRLRTSGFDPPYAKSTGERRGLLIVNPGDGRGKTAADGLRCCERAVWLGLLNSVASAFALSAWACS